jgi:hypothetical protein
MTDDETIITANVKSVSFENGHVYINTDKGKYDIEVVTAISDGTQAGGSTDAK